MEGFISFLQQYQVEKGSQYTHTSFTNPAGSFYIPGERFDDFIKLYVSTLSSGAHLHLTEKHRDLSPFLIDLDFRFDSSQGLERTFNDQAIQEVLAVYIKYIFEYIDIETFTIYVLQKPAPVFQKNLVKDGIHVVIPDVVTSPAVQYIIRNKIMSELAPIFEKYRLVNKVDEIVDEAIIERNTWMMYGSRKPNCEPYQITAIYDAATFTTLPIKDNTADYVAELSIRNKFEATQIKFEMQEEVQTFHEELIRKKKDKMMKNTSIFQSHENMKKNVSEDLDTISKLVNILSEDRANVYEQWIRLGWCLRNIDHRLVDVWTDFSRKSPKFAEGECERLWRHMRDDGLGIGSLHMWAKEDNPEAYKDLMQNSLQYLMWEAKSQTHHDIAKVVHFLYKYEYVCVNIKSNDWYQFKNHRWVECNTGYTLREKLSTDICCRFFEASAECSRRAIQAGDEEQKKLAETSKKFTDIATNLKKSSFKENIMKECRDLFYHYKFEEKLDSRPHLIGFENGVFDLDAFEFREGRPEDYISFTTKINYVPYDQYSPFAEPVDVFLSQIFPKQHMKDYTLGLLSTFLSGNIKEQKFNIWTGTGSNGKSKLIDLFECCFGEYCCKLPITLLTQKRVASNAATAELARTKGKRFACLQEPSEDEKLNVGLMKELSGGDKIMARALYREPIEFKPQFKMILTCNQLPNVPSDDGGTWRRIRLVEFTSRFCENPQLENEFSMDHHLSEKFENWKEYFMSLLLEYYRTYDISGTPEPEEVLKCTKEYQKNNDTMLEFVESQLERAAPEESVSTVDCFNCFKNWCKDNNIAITSGYRRSTFIKNITKHMTSKPESVGGVQAWRSWRFKSSLDALDGL